MSGPTTLEDSQQEGNERFLTCLGVRVPFDTQVLSHRMRVALRTDNYENKEAKAALKLVKEGDVVLELGAGIGFMSSIIASQTKAHSVHSYEANPDLIAFIKRVHAMNGIRNATINNAVLGSGTGTVPFYIRRNFLSSSLSPLDDDIENPATKTAVPVVDGNQVLDALRPTVLVCDIEGAESTLFQELDLSGLRAALVELHPQFVGKSGVKAVFDAMDRAGMTYFPRWSNAKVVCFRKDW